MEETENFNIINNYNEKNNLIEEKTSIKSKYLKAFLNFYEHLNRKLTKYGNKVLILKKKYLYNIKNDDEEKLFIITDKIIETYQIFFINLQKSTEKIIEKIKYYLYDYNKLEIKYSIFNDIKKIYQQKHKKIIELKNNYHQNGKELEKIAMNNFEKTIIDFSEIDKILSKTKDSLNKYRKEVIEINKYKKEYNNKQIDLMENYTKFERIFLYDLIKEEFNKFLDKHLKVISTVILEINTAKKLNPKKIEDNKFRSFNNIRTLEEEKIIHFPSNINFDECSEEKDYLIYDKTVKYIKNNIGDETLYQDYNEEKEKNRNEIRKIIIPFFDRNNINKEISQESRNELINALKNSSNHHLFLLIMSKFRVYKEHNKEWIDLMGDCLNIILDECFVSNDYNEIKNCMILSQTYYYTEEENNTKIYLIKKIENREIFKENNFWKNFIEDMIIKQLEIYQETNKLINVDLIQGVGITDNLIKKLGDLFFTQLLSYVNNMIEFNNEKKQIIDIVNYFKEKYKYLAKEDYETLLSVISNRVK